jgi:hypothetical protein
MKFIYDAKDTKMSGVQVPENEKHHVNALIETRKDNVKMLKLQEARKNNLGLQRENSKTCLVM